MKKIIMILCILASCSKKNEISNQINCNPAENIYSKSSNTCEPIMCSLANSNLPNAAIVSGILKDKCYIVECQPDFELKNGLCEDKRPILSLNQLYYITKETAITLTGKCESGDVISIVEPNQIEINGICQDNKFSMQYSINHNLSNLYFAQVKSKNAKGIISSVEFSYMIDRISPIISIEPLPLITSQNYSVTNISGTCSENGKNVDVSIVDTFLNKTDQNCICIFSTWSCNLPINLMDGEFSIIAKQIDDAGNSVSENILSSSLMSAIGVSQWGSQFGFSFTQTNSIDMIHDSLGNIYITGYTYGSLFDNLKISPSGFPDGFVSKYNSNGSRLWTKQFGTIAGSTGGYYMTKDSNNNILIVGNTNGNLHGNTKIGSNDGFLMKINADGIIQWTKQFGTALSTDTSVKAIEVDNNAIYVGGITTGQFSGNMKKSSNGFFDGYVSKFDLSGNIVWVKQFGVTNGNTLVADIAISNNIYVIGSTVGSLYSTVGSQSLGYNQIYYAGHDSSTGSVIESNQFGSIGSTHSYGNQIKFDSNGNMYIAGTTEGMLFTAVQADNGPTSPDTNGFIIKYNKDHNRQWVTQFGAWGGITLKKMDLDNYGNIYVTGASSGLLFENTSGNYLNGAYLIKFLHNSQYKWSREFGTRGSGQTYSQSLTIFNDELYLTGYTTGSFGGNSQSGSSDGFIVKYK